MTRNERHYGSKLTNRLSVATLLFVFLFFLASTPEGRTEEPSLGEKIKKFFATPTPTPSHRRHKPSAGKSSPTTDAIPRRFFKINLPAQAKEFSDACLGGRRNTQAEAKEIVPDAVAQPDRNSDTNSTGIAHVIAQSGTEGGDDRA